MKKICFIVSSPGTAVAFLKQHLLSLKEEFEVHLVANFTDNSLEDIFKGIIFHPIKIERKINLICDVDSLFHLYNLFRRERFEIVHSVTPKAGLITAIAGFVAMIPHRIHIFTGQVWATRKGLMRCFLKMMDRLIAILNNHILVDGNSQREFLICNHIVSRKKSLVLGAGSICGVNVERFRPQARIRQIEREKLKLTDRHIVFVFLGRLNRDKGVYELFSAFNQLASRFNNVFLLLAGPDEEGCMQQLNAYTYIDKGVNCEYIGVTRTPEYVLQAGDIFCLPSYREGFGSSVIEASCLGLPVICSDTYGIMDAMIEKETGLRCKVGDVTSLYNSMKLLYESAALRNRLGQTGRKRVLEQFDSTIITKAWVRYYDSLLKTDL